MVDLWPNKYDKVSKKAPLTVMKEQAKLINNKTNSKVNAKIKRVAIPLRNNDSLRFHLLFSTPALQHYHYRHFAVEHEFDLYPVFFYLNEETQKEVNPQLKKPQGVLTVKSEEELQLVLKEIFRAPETQRIIRKIGSSTEAST